MALRNIFLNRKYKFLSYKGTICRSLSTLSHSNEHFFSKTAFIDGKYLNPWEIESNQSNHFIKYMHSKIFDTFEDHPASDNIPKIELPTTACDISKIKSIDQPHVTWIGHSTCLVQSGGVHIITDPVWSARCSPFASVGPLRRSDPALPVEDLPIDIVLLSHSHYDHLDLPTARRIGNRAIWAVPLGLKDLLAAEGITNCVELDWWETRKIKAPAGEVEVTLLPARHWSARSLFDKNCTLWGSFAARTSQGNYYFAGDTAYCDRLFAAIGRRFGPFDLSLLPIGAYRPRVVHRNSHCDPREAVLMHNELRSKRSLAIHWGTFDLADDMGCEPGFELMRARAAEGVSAHDFFTMVPGQSLFLDEPATADIAQILPAETEIYLKHALTGPNTADDRILKSTSLSGKPIGIQ